MKKTNPKPRKCGYCRMLFLPNCGHDRLCKRCHTVIKPERRLRALARGEQ